MKKVWIAWAVALLAMPAAAMAAEKVVEGELVDSKCYVGMDAKGAKHQQCAVKCATAGFPVGVLTGNGQYYTILVPSSAFKDVMALQARVTGDVNEETKTIEAKKVEAKQGGQWVEVKVPGMPM